MSNKTNISVSLSGHLLIRDTSNGEVLVNKHNAIHLENTSIVLAASFANRSVDGGIYKMAFGTGGSFVNSVGDVSFLATNITGSSDLHTNIFEKIIDDTRGAAAGNGMAVKHIAGTNYSDVEITALLTISEPSGQPVSDVSTVAGTPNINSIGYAIDEIGLKSDTGKLLTHVIFTPIIKAANRELEIVYTIRITTN